MWTRQWGVRRRWCLARFWRRCGREAAEAKGLARKRIFKSQRFLNPLPGFKLRAPLEMRHLSSIPRYRQEILVASSDHR
ncbi:hypothetical protein CBM2599_B30032 [Cupriavidus taiwanensis]|nr:hypothetical protein CBM2599_B30032 [Cupriavidus taiwanensis]SOY98777.1 hypothetical protein CBM2600_B30287 [Cupriavidus taiwanensis]